VNHPTEHDETYPFQPAIFMPYSDHGALRQGRLDGIPDAGSNFQKAGMSDRPGSCRSFRKLMRARRKIDIWQGCFTRRLTRGYPYIV